MAAAAWSFVVEQGSTFYRKLVLSDFSGAPLDLGGYALRAQVRPTPESSEVYATWTTDNGRFLLLNPEQGEVVFEISASETAGYTWREGVYDLELVDPVGRVERLLEGKVYVSPETTRIGSGVEAP